MIPDDDVISAQVGLLRAAEKALRDMAGPEFTEKYDDLARRTIEGARDWRALDVKRGEPKGE